MKKPLMARIKDPAKFLFRIVLAPTYKKRIDQSRAYIESLRGIHTGKRCFIIGNGPSLNAADLDKIKGEISFGANRIYNIFSDTNWRPTYYFVQDPHILRSDRELINDRIKCDKFVGLMDYQPTPPIDGAYYLKVMQEFYTDEVEFSDDLTKEICDGTTITYSAIQMAVYMGFSEIFLLGVDHSYTVERDKNGKIVRNQDVKADHFSASDKVGSVPWVYRMEQSYETARNYADAHGIKIYNATRGGKLEIFERADFDTLF